MAGVPLPTDIFARSHAPLQPRLGLLAGLRRFLFGDRAKQAHVSDHGAFMRSLGRAWAIPMTLVFSTGALITLGQTQIGLLVRQVQRGEPLDYVALALLAITFVIVGGMDLTLLNSAVELRDARLRGVDPSTDPYTKGAKVRVWLVSLIESATFMSVAYQLEKPPSFSQDLAAAAVAWAFIVARALIAPVCAMYLATLGKRAMVRREMYGNLLLTIGGTIQQILENLQFAADERLIEPLWRMQVLIDRASRATTDTEMDAFDDDLLKALGELRRLRDQLYQGHQEHQGDVRRHGQVREHADEPAGGSVPLFEPVGLDNTDGEGARSRTAMEEVRTEASPLSELSRLVPLPVSQVTASGTNGTKGTRS